MKLIETIAPHIHTSKTTQRTMLIVLISLLPCAIAGVYYFGAATLINMIVSVLSAMIFEALWQVCTKQKVTVSDGSAAVTGLLIALCVTPSAPWWIFIVGSAFAILIVKQCFGGLGDNFLNPALAARAMMLASWPAYLTTHISLDAVTSATPLRTGSTAYADLFIGRIPGALGETCVPAILLGFIILLATGVIEWHIPVVTVAAATIMGWILGMDPISTMLSGGLLFGAVFMATDYVTSPMKTSAQVLYAVGIGVITVLLRKFSVFPEGVTYAVLIMNILSPLLDKWMPEHVYGYAKKGGRS